MNEYRCTRPDLYDSPGCTGHKNPSARQGHYVNAESLDDALAQMKKKFPSDKKFEGELWKSNV